jgi:plasmid stabilization system protein ParE
MTFAVRFSAQSREDLIRLYEHMLDQAETLEDLARAERAQEAILTAAQILAQSPFLFRKAGRSALRRELVIPFASTGYVLLYEIAGPAQVVILAVRHQREQDYR